MAEHRDNQRRALLHAARGLLLDSGPDAVTPAALGHAVGLARNSVYKYFASSSDILAQLVETSFRDWACQIRAAVAAQQTPSSRIDAYIRTTVELAAAGQHRIAGAVTAAHLPEPCRARIGELHRELAEPLLSALVERGDTHPEITAALVQGALDAAVRLIHAGEPPGDVLAATTQLLRRGTEAGHR